MLIECAVCPLLLRCTGRGPQAANPSIEISSKEHMSFCLRCHKMRSQLGKSTATVILM